VRLLCGMFSVTVAFTICKIHKLPLNRLSKMSQILGSAPTSSTHLVQIMCTEVKCNRYYHRPRGITSPVLTAMAVAIILGKCNFKPHHRIDTLQPITKQFVVNYYIGDPCNCAKLGVHMFTGGFWAHMGEL